MDGCRLITLPNPWRVRAKGLVIRQVPVALYSDDTSGTVSKKWNKHMSFYFILAGLPPKLGGLGFNVKFLSSSNSATALEMADSIVDELK